MKAYTYYRRGIPARHFLAENHTKAMLLLANDPTVELACHCAAECAKDLNDCNYICRDCDVQYMQHEQQIKQFGKVMTPWEGLEDTYYHVIQGV